MHSRKPRAEQGNNTLRKPERHPWSSCHHYRTISIIHIQPRGSVGQQGSIPQLEVLASLQRKLLLGLALRALQTQDNLLGGLGLFTEDRLGLTTETLLLSVVTTLTLSVQRGLYFTKVTVSAHPFQGEGSILTFPALYWVTLCWVCLWQSLDLQYVRRVFGTLTW